MDILLVDIDGSFKLKYHRLLVVISGYWWLNYHRLLVAISGYFYYRPFVVILLMIIDGYYINGY